MTFAISLDPDHYRQIVGPDLNPNYVFDTLIILLKEFLENII